jgi:hypothetical protein
VLAAAGALASRADVVPGRDFRRVDEARVRAQIEQGALSDHRALYWRALDGSVPAPPTGLDAPAPNR